MFIKGYWWSATASQQDSNRVWGAVVPGIVPWASGRVGKGTGACVLSIKLFYNHQSNQIEIAFLQSGGT